jgi:hypothetical protein
VAFLIRPGWMVNGLVCRGCFLFASFIPTDDNNNNNNNNNNKHTHAHTHTRPNQYVNKMIQRCIIKGYTQTEKLQQIDQI